MALPNSSASTVPNAAGRVDAALALAAAVLQGGQLTTALQAVAAHLATEAARAQLQLPSASAAAGAHPLRPRLHNLFRLPAAYC